jgi:hypothetical protein
MAKVLGNGMAVISKKKATEGDTNFIDHNNVLQATKRKGTLKDVKNARNAKEVLFKGEVPASAVVEIKN